jgi:hypothetical protein
LVCGRLVGSWVDPKGMFGIRLTRVRAGQNGTYGPIGARACGIGQADHLRIPDHRGLVILRFGREGRHDVQRQREGRHPVDHLLHALTPYVSGLIRPAFRTQTCRLLTTFATIEA